MRRHWQADACLRRKNTLALPATSRWYVRSCTLASLLSDIQIIRRQRLMWRLLGQGSNVIMRDFDGVTLTPDLPGIQVRGDRSSALVRVGAGVDWPMLVGWCCAQGLHGLENLAMIPGSAGAAPVQNIGAYGMELSRRLVCLDALDTSRDDLVRLQTGDCGFAYRNSRFREEPGRYVICALYLSLGSRHTPLLDYPEVAEEVAVRGGGHQAVYEAVCALRKQKLPDLAEQAHAGSFFYNPTLSREEFHRLQAQWPDVKGFAIAGGQQIRVSAAQLIEACGWKGRALQNCGLSDRHALVAVNHGGATAQNLCDLAKAIQRDVKGRFDVQLSLEPALI